MICYFREDFKSSIKVEIEQQDQISINFEEMVQRAINAKAKLGLKSSTMVRDLDIRCLRDHRLFNNTTSKVQTQETTAKDSQQEELRVKEIKSTLFWAAETSKLFEQARKERKKKKHQERRDNKQTPASTANAMEIQQKKKKKT